LDIFVGVRCQRLDLLDKLPSAEVGSPPATAVENSRVASDQTVLKVGEDLLTGMRHKDGFNVLIHSHPGAWRDRMDQKRQATRIVLGREVLKNSEKSRCLVVGDFVVRWHGLMRSKK
jgi:hypothetical protein